MNTSVEQSVEDVTLVIFVLPKVYIYTHEFQLIVKT